MIITSDSKTRECVYQRMFHLALVHHPRLQLLETRAREKKRVQSSSPYLSLRLCMRVFVWTK